MSKTSLQNFLENGGKSGNILTVTLIKKLSTERYIVGDNSSLAVLEYPKNGKDLKIGSGIKLIKPVCIDDKTVKCNSNFSPLKTLEHDKVTPKQEQLQKFESKIENTKECTTENKYLTFEEIEKMTTGKIIQNITFLVTRMSKIIPTTSGHYQICGLKDIEGKNMSINLYDKFMNTVEVGNVFTATKIKKFNLKKDGQFQTRLSTTKFTSISKALQRDKLEFDNIGIADNSLDAIILGFSDINCYFSCAKHWNKIDDEGDCPVCNGKPEKIQFDFKAKLLVECNEDKEEIRPFLMFKRAATMITNEETEELVENKLAEYCGSQCTVEYDDSDEELVILKRLVTFM